MLDNGAFSIWNSGKSFELDGFYKWAEPWLDSPNTWAVIPDVIAGDEDLNKSMAISSPLPRHKSAPVWHLHESLDYLRLLADNWHRVCFGSSAQYAVVGSPAWHERVHDAFNAIWDRKPSVHMLRGMKCSRMPYPFASVDSTDVARNHWAVKNGDARAREMADRWDGIQCPMSWDTARRLATQPILLETA